MGDGFGSDRPEGDGWWLASDGRWYPPELHPDRSAPEPGTTPEPSLAVWGDTGPDAERPAWWATPLDAEGPPAEIEPPRRRVAPALLAILLVLVAVAGAALLVLRNDDGDGATSVATSSTTTSGGSATTVPAPTAPSTTAPGGTAPTTTGTTAVPTTTTLPFEPGGNPFGDGVNPVFFGAVGPGVYARVGVEGPCTWRRLAPSDDGPPAVIVEAVAVTGRELLEVLPTDGAVESIGCGGWTPWQPVEPPGTVGDGAWVVGSEIPPGPYVASTPGPECVYLRTSGFSGEPGTTLASGTSTGEPVEVVLEPTDVGFKTYGCGTWQPAG